MLGRDILRIAKFANVVTPESVGEHGTHESVLRAYQILERVKDMLEDGVPPSYILTFIDIMEGAEP